MFHFQNRHHILLHMNISWQKFLYLWWNYSHHCLTSKTLCLMLAIPCISIVNAKHATLHAILLILFYYLPPPPFSFPPIFIYSLVLCFFVFIAYVILNLISIIFFFCTFHWADLSWPTFHYWLYPVWLCMWQIIKNLEPYQLTTATPILNIPEYELLLWW